MQSKIEEETTLHHQLIIPKPFRYPVLTSDGHNYEASLILMWLKEHNNTSPKTGQQIDCFTYNLQLKNEIDILDPEDRYPDYDKEDTFSQLNAQVNPTLAPWKQAIYQSSLTTAIFISLLATVDWILSGNSLQPSSLMKLMVAIALTDYLIRFNSNYRYGFFEGISKGTKAMANSAEHCWFAICSADPDMDESIFRL